MKKVLLTIILLFVAACGPKFTPPDETVEAPEVRYAGDGGYFVPEDSESGQELFCRIEHFEIVRGPYIVRGLFLQGWFTSFEREKEISHDHVGEFIYLVDARVTSSDVAFHTFIRRAEVWVENDLIAWVDSVPKYKRTITPNFDGSVNLAKYGNTFVGTGLVKARYPAIETSITLRMKFRRHYGCREGNND